MANTIWLEMGNLNHLLLGMIFNLDIIISSIAQIGYFWIFQNPILIKFDPFCTMIGNGKFEPFTVLNDIELRYRITASQWAFYISEKMKKAQKIFLKAISKTRQKKWLFYIFFALIWSNGLENSANVFGLTFKTIKTKKAAQRLNIRKSHIWKRRTQILLS